MTKGAVYLHIKPIEMLEGEGSIVKYDSLQSVNHNKDEISFGVINITFNIELQYINHYLSSIL